MSGYTPLFNEIVTSSIWNESNPTRIVWITMLALAEKDGIVNASVAGLAPVARVTIEECELAIEILSSPDKYSRSIESEGRRIEPCDGGWRIINHNKYREKAKSRAAYMREYRRNRNVTQCNTRNSNVTKRSPTNANANANIKEKEEKEKERVTKFKPPTLEQVLKYTIEQNYRIDCQRFIDFYESKGWMIGKNKMKDWKACVRNWARGERKEQKAKNDKPVLPPPAKDQDGLTPLQRAERERNARR